MGTVVIILLVGGIVLVSILSGFRIMGEKEKQLSAGKPEGGGKSSSPKPDKGKR